jgi:hypothetical protein
MAFNYEEVVPWGRSFDEYRRMFALTDDELQLKIVGCGDGPASFNAEAFRRGVRVVSCDPLYMFSPEQIRQRIEVTYENVISQTRENRDKFVWDELLSVENLGRVRMKAMDDFLKDYDGDQKQGRYISAELPRLPFRAFNFDLALCSHFLFLYSDNLDFSFHKQALEEMCRAAREARVFPVLDYNGQRSAHVDPLITSLGDAGFSVSLEYVPYEFQRGGNQMMKISSAPV